MGAAFVMLIPLGIYLYRKTGRKRWLVATALITLGALATVSRTSLVMLVAVALTYVRLRPKEVKRFWPLLLPSLLLVHFAVPGTIGNLTQSFRPAGGLVAQQEKGGVGSGRLATLGPALRNEFVPHPLLGEGFGTRVVTHDSNVPVNAPILDDQWLGTLCETGLLGVAAWLAIFMTFIRRANREARADPSDRGALLVSLSASVTAFAAGMFFYDAFSFIQVTFLLFVLIALGACTLATQRGPMPVPSS
jgi:O-antigen ligase